MSATVQIQVATATGRQLDWLVAVAEGATELMSNGIDLYFYLDGKVKILSSGWAATMCWAPSSDWSTGGPIIEREDISVIRCDDESIPDDKGFYCGKYESRWAAVIGDRHSTESDYGSQGDYWGLYYKIASSAVIGPTLLTAAMRCRVASKLGDTVEIPDYLT